MSMQSACARFIGVSESTVASVLCGDSSRDAQCCAIDYTLHTVYTNNTITTTRAYNDNYID